MINVELLGKFQADEYDRYCAIGIETRKGEIFELAACIYNKETCIAKQFQIDVRQKNPGVLLCDKTKSFPVAVELFVKFAAPYTPFVAAFWRKKDMAIFKRHCVDYQRPFPLRMLRIYVDKLYGNIWPDAQQLRTPGQLVGASTRALRVARLIHHLKFSDLSGQGVPELEVIQPSPLFGVHPLGS